MNKTLKSLLLYCMILFFASCESPVQYIEVEKEIYVTEYIEIPVIETIIETVIETEYIEVPTEIIVEKYIEVDKIVEVITEVEVDKIIETEKIVEIEVEKIVTVDNYIEIPVVETVTEYVDRIETITAYVDRIETVTEFVEVPVEKIVNNDIIVNTETIIYVEKEVYVMSEPEVFVHPIKEYSNYITRENKVLGVTSDGFEEIPLIKGLFIIDGVLYFKIDEKFYSQSGGVISECVDFPGVPASTFIDFSDGPYKIQESVYNESPISKVYNGSPNVAYMQIDGACMRGSDLLYSVSVGIAGREVGVYLWTVNGNPLRVMEDGRIW